MWEKLNLRTIEVRTVDNASQLIVPNGQLLQGVVTSYTRTEKRVRMHVRAATSMEANPHQAVEALLEAAKEQEGYCLIRHRRRFLPGLGACSGI
ncbi:MAG: mechanosensitive ion channel [Chloroflexota bacterium]